MAADTIPGEGALRWGATKNVSPSSTSTAALSSPCIAVPLRTRVKLASGRCTALAMEALSVPSCMWHCA
eukprot:scaffold175886_cov17-Tisochrysis_lutea.AAC.1